jgi:uncharacterized protein YkwD
MKNYTIGFAILTLSFLGIALSSTGHAQAATRHTAKRSARITRRAKRTPRKHASATHTSTTNAPASVLAAQSAPAGTTTPNTTPTPATVATGSNSNPSPTVIQNPNDVSSTTFSQCDNLTNFSEKFGCLINNYRQMNGKNPLKFDAALTKTASNYSNYMNSANFFSHVAPDGSHYYERCVAEGTTCHGENLAEGFLSAQNLFDMWKSSPAHNENMLGPYTSMGLGISGKYATNLFRW